MKAFYLPLLASLALGWVASAQNVQTLDDSRYSLSSGGVTMTVDAARGGKILSFRLQDKEVLSQTRFPNSFGSTFWTSPQAEWDWPPVAEYDSKPYEASVQDGRLVLTGQKSERFGYRIRKEFSTDPQDGAFVIKYTIVNESGETRRVAPWEISRVPNGGLLFFDAQEVTGANGMTSLPFEYKYKGAWYTVDEARENRKVNADGRGWLGFADNGLLFIKKFQDLDATQPAPAEAEIQIYVNTGKTFVEVEEQGPYTTLEPGSELDWTVRWYLLPYDGTATPSKALFKKARRVVR
ncbi:MAG: DUF4380 domain-containing protein [Bacteroidales bacterium]|nr:DUF4380 domain-containing protein [Bacteroidales bacterium]